MSEPPPHADLRRRRAVRVLGLPAAIGAVPCLVLRTEARSILAPLLGPFAGNLYGHSDCTLASMWPGWSWTAVAVGAACIGSFALARGRRALLIASIASALWSTSWTLMALASVLNTTV